MNRTFVRIVAGSAVCALAFSPTFAFAGGKGKSDRASFAQSMNGNSQGGSSSAMKLRASQSNSLSLGNSNSSSLSKSLSTRSSKSFSQFNSNQLSLQNFSTNNGNGNSNFTKKKITSSQTLLGTTNLNSAGRTPPRFAFPTMNQQNLANAVQTGKFTPIDSGIGNGTGGQTIKWPGKFTAADSNTLADVIKKHQIMPLGPIGNGGPGNGNGIGNDICKDKKDCHKDCKFPWWPIIVGGGFNGGHCKPHHHGCYDNYHGGYCTSIVNVTNVIVEQPIITGQPILVPGVDLELVDVRLVDPGDLSRNLGPRYRLVFGNRGTLPAGNFQVMLMATIDGTPQPGVPLATAEIAGLASRQVFMADVRLPLTADFSTLSRFIAVIDSASQIGEVDENNNVAVLDATRIAVADATVALQ